VSTSAANKVVLTHDRGSVGQQPPDAGPFDIEGNRLGDGAGRLGHIGFVALSQLEEHLRLTTNASELQSVVIAIEFGLMAEQPLFAHPGERRFARDAPYPGNNRRQRRPAEESLLHTVLGAGLKLESFGSCRHSPSELQRVCLPSCVEEAYRGLDAD
jgi:hypothetical protein